MTRSGSLRFAAGVVAGLLISLAPFAALWRTAAATSQQTTAASGLPASLAHSEAPVHILVLGVDEREGESGRSDTMMIAHVTDGQARLLSIPRDTMVTLAEHGESKVNAAFAYGGVPLARETVSNLLGLQIDYYVKVNFAGFRQLVDLMGGVVYNVEKPMHYEDPTDGLVIDLEPGLQRLDGAKAEQYVRFRYDESGEDTARIRRQQSFLKEAAAQLMTPGNLPKLPKLLAAAQTYVETDLPVTEALKVAYQAYGAVQHGALIQEMLPGRSTYVDQIAYFIPDTEQLRTLIDRWQEAE